MQSTARITCLVISLACLAISSNANPTLTTQTPENGPSIALTLVSGDFGYPIKALFTLIGIKAPHVLDLPIMPLDMDNYAHREIDLPELKYSATASWNQTLTLPRSFYTDKTYLAFQFYDDLMQFEPSEYVSGAMLTVGELLSGPQERTFQLNYYGHNSGKATVKWSLVEN